MRIAKGVYEETGHTVKRGCQARRSLQILLQVLDDRAWGAEDIGTHRESLHRVLISKGTRQEHERIIHTEGIAFPFPLSFDAMGAGDEDERGSSCTARSAGGAGDDWVDVP